MQKQNILTYITLAIILATAFIPAIPQGVKIAIMGVGLALIVWSRRGAIYFTQANKKIMSQKSELVPKALTQYRKAIKAGIPVSYAVTIGSVFLQQGLTDEGMEILADAAKNAGKDKKNRHVALIALSMGYWIKGNIDEAIRLCEKVRDEGYSDRNIYINLTTYYLNKGDITAFRKTLRECRSKEIKAPAITDLEATSEILAGNWKDAGRILSEMLTSRDFKFADPYVHMAQVKIHYGTYSEAVHYLEKALEKCQFTQTAIIKEDTIKELVSLLKDEKSQAKLASAIDHTPLLLINGQIPAWQDALPFTPGETEPDYQEIVQIEENTEPTDDDEAHTDLTADDEEWLKKHQE